MEGDGRKRDRGGSQKRRSTKEETLGKDQWVAKREEIRGTIVRLFRVRKRKRWKGLFKRKKGLQGEGAERLKE